jgi:hypothetical protein
MNYVTYNQRFKPKQIVKLHTGHPGVTVKELFPAFTSTLALDPKFMDDCSAYSKPAVSVNFPADYIATVKNGRIFAYDNNNFAVITEDNKLIDEASFQWIDSPVPATENRVFNVKGFSKPRKYSGTVFSLLTMGAAKDYYFHWMFDALTKLELLKRSGLFDTVDYFLVPSYKYQFNKEYLDYFNIPSYKIISEDMEHHIQADQLMVCSEVRLGEHLPKWSCDFFYDSFAKSLENNKRGRRIYIARGDAAKNRKVSNESKLIEVLKSQGFEILYLTKVSVVDQVKIFNSADLIVAVHGGGLSNLVFCEPGTTVLEIFPDQYVRHYFYDICVKRNLAYDYLLCPSTKPCKDHFEGEVVGLTVDIDAVQNKINLLMGRNHVAKTKVVTAENTGLSSGSMTWAEAS